MKNILIKSLLVCFAVFLMNSCREHENLNYDGESFLHFDKKDQIAEDGVQLITYGVTNEVSGDHTVELVFDPAKSTAVLGTDFTIVEGTDVLKSGSVLGDFKINVTPAAAAAKKEAVFRLKSSTLKNGVFNQEVLVKFACASALAGTYEYTTINYFSPDVGVVLTTPLVGNVILGNTAVGSEYLISDASFGSYKAFYGGSSAATNVKLQDLCKQLSFVGTNQYGDTHTISNVSVNGANLTFKWSTSYGEYGTTTLRRTDGSSWPALF